MKKFWITKAFLILLFFAEIFVCGQETSADTIYGSSNLSRYYTKNTEDGPVTESVVGVGLRYRQGNKWNLVTYAADTWIKRDGTWSYLGSEYNGKQGVYTTHRPSSSSVQFLSDSSPRFGLNTGIAKRDMEDVISGEYSLVTEKYCRGQQVEQYVEYSFQSLEELAKRKDSLMYGLVGNGETIELGSFEPEGVTYLFFLYPAISIQQGEVISADVGECTMTRAGKAFYSGSYYYIKEFPQVAAPKGHSITVDGWYDQKEGGRKYEAGELIPSGKTLYLHYKLETNQYTVQCLDMIGSTSGLQLGSSQWKQAYGSTATGAQAGAVPLPDTYYPGMYYTGCTTGVVSEQGVTVYRIFQYASYPVTIVDMVNTGRQSGNVLGRNQKQCVYQQVVNGGSLLGNSKTEGIYYTGYVYCGESSSRVEVGGITVYRYFAPITYSVYFDGNGANMGNMDPLIGCEYGSVYSLPLNGFEKIINITFDLQSEEAVYDMGDIELKRGFRGWAQKPEGNVLYVNGDTVQNLSDVSSENTLYAMWEKVTFESKTHPKRMGYQFAGWSEKADALQGNSSLALTEDTTLYAIWKPDVTQYHVEYYKETLSGLFEKSAEYTFNDYSGKKITLENIDELYPGYYIDTSSSVLSGTIKGDGSLILTVYYRRNTYNIQFDLDGGTVKQEYPVLSGVYESAIEIPETIPQKENYQFMGWTADKGSEQIYCHPGDIYHVPNHNQTLYAVWKPDKYQIYYMKDQEEIITKQEYAFYEDICLPECDVEKKGYQFIGWKQKEDENTYYSSGQTIASRFETKNGIVRFYAVWKPISGIIVFEKNAPEDEAAVMGSVPPLEYVYDTPCTIPEKTYFLAGYDFLGWNTKSDGSGKIYTAGMSVRNVFDTEGENHLFAMWAPSSDTKFVLHLFKETLTGELPETEEIIPLKGETNQTVFNAVLAYYHKDSIEDVFEGFSVDNQEAMEERVRADGATIVKLHLSRREYTVTVSENFQGDSYYSQMKCKYEDSLILGEQIEGVGTVARYIDGDGNVFWPGDAMQILKDITLIPQHKVCYQLDGSIVKEHYINHKAYETAFCPEQKEYHFDGWYIDGHSSDRYCSAGDRVRIEKDMLFAGKWTQDKIIYHILYEMGIYDGVVALEAFIDSYQYGDLVVLPTKEQIYIPNKYKFIGWYEQGDSRRTIVTKIPAEAYGDKMYCLLLEEREQTDVPNEPSEPVFPSESPDISGSGNNSDTESPDTSEDNNDNRDDGMDHDGNIEGSHGDDSTDIEQDTNIGGQDEKSQTIVSPIDSGTKQGGDSTQKEVTETVRFTKKKVQYQALKGNKNQVEVIGVDPTIRKVTIPEKVTWNHRKYSVTRIANKAFYSHKVLQKVVIGGRVKTIGKQAFANINHLNSVTLGKNVTTIKAKAFYNSKSLKKVIVKGKHVKKIGKNAFGKTKAEVKIFVSASYGKKYCEKLKHKINVK